MLLSSFTTNLTRQNKKARMLFPHLPFIIIFFGGVSFPVSFLPELGAQVKSYHFHSHPFTTPRFPTAGSRCFALQFLRPSPHGAPEVPASYQSRPASREPLLPAPRAHIPYPAVLARPGGADSQDFKMASIGKFPDLFRATRLKAGVGVWGPVLRAALGGEGPSAGAACPSLRTFAAPGPLPRVPRRPTLLSSPRRASRLPRVRATRLWRGGRRQLGEAPRVLRMRCLGPPLLSPLRNSCSQPCRNPGACFAPEPSAQIRSSN